MCHDLELLILCLYLSEFLKFVTEQLNAKSLDFDSMQCNQKSYTEAILLDLQ